MRHNHARRRTSSSKNDSRMRNVSALLCGTTDSFFPVMRNSLGGEQVVKVGDVIEGRYRILRPLGEGGMGTVFLAEHALIKRRVAIKILHPEFAADADGIEGVINEARAA